MNTDCSAGLEPVKREVNADGLRISYLVWGERGPDVVLLHGITSCARTWWRVAPQLVRAGFRVTALDMPGHGDSDRPDGQYLLTQTAHTVDAVMSALGLRLPIVIGHSWGGGTTLVHATEPATKVPPARIVLVDPLLRTVTDGTAYCEGLVARLGKPREEMVPFLRNIYPKWHDCDVHWKAEALLQGDPATVRGVFREGAGLDLVPRLLHSPAPWALFLADPDRGGIIPRAMWPELETAARKNRGQIIPMPGIAHDMYREDFEGFMALLIPFMTNR